MRSILGTVLTSVNSMATSMIEANIKQFFTTARERYRILLRRQTPGKVAPFTEDKIFQTWRFCNTFREDDKTTVWFRHNVRGPLQRRAEDVIRATIACRWFNRISTWELIQQRDATQLIEWNIPKIREILTGVNPVVTGAYIIKTPNGKNKLEGILWCLEQVFPDIEHLAARLQPDTSLEGFWEVLQGYPYLGGFMAYQIVSDLIHTCVLQNAPDRMTWTCMGPGSTRGLGWLCGNNPATFSRSSKGDVATMVPLCRTLLERSQDSSLWAAGAPSWEMQSIQHWLCEYDKYRRAESGQDQKRRFS